MPLEALARAAARAAAKLFGILISAGVPGPPAIAGLAAFGEPTDEAVGGGFTAPAVCVEATAGAGAASAFATGLACPVAGGGDSPGAVLAP